MKILIDGMGGDYSPEEIVKGAVRAASEIDATVGIVGPEWTLNKLLKENNWQGNNIEIINATEVIENNEHPAMAIRRKRNSSIVVGMNLLREGKGDAFISAGSTGALLSGGLLILGRLKGIKRPAIAAWVPKIGKEGTTLMLDCGANMDIKPESLLQFGIMGSLFVNGIKGIKEPDVKLLNVGLEEGKGDDLHREAYDLLKESSINFTGNIESREIIFGECDVVVADGFSGNVFIKGVEGVSLAIMGRFKKKLTQGAAAKLGAALASKRIHEIKDEFDYSDVGGAPILGLTKPVLKIHGNSTAVDVYYAIKKAIPFVETDITGMIAEAVAGNDELSRKKVLGLMNNDDSGRKNRLNIMKKEK